MSMKSLYPIFSILAVSSVTTGCVAVIVAVARFLSWPKRTTTLYVYGQKMRLYLWKGTMISVTAKCSVAHASLELIKYSSHFP
jgi:hypothetical protein